MGHWNLQSLHKSTRELALAKESSVHDIEKQQKTKTININGQDIKFELVRNVTTKPEISRKERKDVQFRHINLDPKVKTSFDTQYWVGGFIFLALIIFLA